MAPGCRTLECNFLVLTILGDNLHSSLSYYSSFDLCLFERTSKYPCARTWCTLVLPLVEHLDTVQTKWLMWGCFDLFIVKHNYLFFRCRDVTVSETDWRCHDVLTNTTCQRNCARRAVHVIEKVTKSNRWGFFQISLIECMLDILFDVFSMLRLNMGYRNTHGIGSASRFPRFIVLQLILKGSNQIPG